MILIQLAGRNSPVTNVTIKLKCVRGHPSNLSFHRIFYARLKEILQSEIVFRSLAAFTAPDIKVVTKAVEFCRMIIASGEEWWARSSLSRGERWDWPAMTIAPAVATFRGGPCYTEPHPTPGFWSTQLYFSVRVNYDPYKKAQQDEGQNIMTEIRLFSWSDGLNIRISFTYPGSLDY